VISADLGVLSSDGEARQGAPLALGGQEGGASGPGRPGRGRLWPWEARKGAPLALGGQAGGASGPGRPGRGRLWPWEARQGAEDTSERIV
jgi:hypothetical protein